jgi:hypothetical protein
MIQKSKLVKKVVTKIETELIQYLKNKEQIVSIILGWSYDKTSINIWFEEEWENYSHCDEDKAICFIEELSYTQLINDLATNKQVLEELESLLLGHKFQEFGNSLAFSDNRKDKAYTVLRNLFNWVLIDVTKSICSREKIGEFDTMVSFKVTDLANRNHPNLTAIYNKQLKGEIIHIEVETSNDYEFECYASFADDAFVLYKVDHSEADWDSYLGNKNRAELSFDEIETFAVKKKYGSRYIDISPKGMESFTLSIKDDNYHTPNNEELIAKIIDFYRANCPDKELVVPEMPAPFDKTAFEHWCNYINESNSKFSWKDAEDAVKQFGLEFLHAFIPQYSSNSKYYEGVVINFINPLIKADEHEKALEYFNTISASKQRDNWYLKLNILMSAQKFDDAITLMKQVKEDEQSYIWIEQLYMPIVKSLKASFEGKLSDAETYLSAIDEESKKDTKSVWSNIYRLSFNNPEEAYQTAKKIFAQKLPLYPNQNYFKHCPKIYELFAKKNELLLKIKEKDKEVLELKKGADIPIKSFDFVEQLQKNIEADDAKFWDVLSKESHKELGSVIDFFEHKQCHYALFTNGSLYKITVNKHQIALQQVTKVVDNPSLLSYNNGKLYIIENNTSIVIYHLDTKQAERNTHRLLDVSVDHIFANGEHIVLCTTAGAEVFRLNEKGHFDCINLLAVGETTSPYTWAKSSIIIDEYLYIASGNNGLVTYKITEKNNPELTSVLTCNYKEPFCDAIFRYNNYLILTMEGKHWLVDIANREKACSVDVLFSTKGGKKTGPLLMDNKLVFFDADKPFVWSYNLKDKQYQVTCEHMAENAESVNIYYIEKLCSIGQYVLISNRYGLSLIKQSLMQKNNDKQIANLLAKCDEIYQAIDQQMNEKLDGNQQPKIGIVMLEAAYSGFEISLYKKSYLSHLMGYSLKPIEEFELSYESFEITMDEPDFLYDIYFEKALKEAKYTVAKNILNQLSKTRKDFFEDEVYYVYHGYNARIDRYSSIVELVN